LTDAASFVLPVDKPVGPTSHDVVAMARRALQVRRIGHTGTLDPFASGLLLLCVGNATRIAEYLTDLPKTYEAVARLDGSTSTDDDTAERMTTSELWRALSAAQVTAAFQSQLGEIEQLPPQYSAKKIDGQRSYEIARRGDVATLTPVRVRIYDITITNIQLPEVEFAVTCSSGTYIRAIARDVGARLGTGGYLTGLHRTSVGRQHVKDALPLSALTDEEMVRKAALTPVQALAHMETLELTDEQARAIRFGQSIAAASALSDPVKLTMNGELIAIAHTEDTRLRPHKVFVDG
jgi:tRNA pseudouridine55 synthase